MPLPGPGSTTIRRCAGGPGPADQRRQLQLDQRGAAGRKESAVPVLLFQAETDTLVDPEAQAEFIQRIPNGRLVRVPGSKHEIYRSEDPILETYWDQLLAFLAG